MAYTDDWENLMNGVFGPGGKLRFDTQKTSPEKPGLPDMNAALLEQQKKLDEMLKNSDIDVVYLCIPNVLHADAALRCLRAGKHVLCEKPATVSAAEMEDILHTARTEGRIFAEAVMNFYSPAARGAGAGFGSLRPSGLQPALQQAGPAACGRAHHEL